MHSQRQQESKKGAITAKVDALASSIAHTTVAI